MEFAIEPKEVTTKAGEVTFAVSNDGSAPHNLEVEGNGIEEVSETIDGGQKTDLTVNSSPASTRCTARSPATASRGWRARSRSSSASERRALRRAAIR